MKKSCESNSLLILWQRFFKSIDHRKKLRQQKRGKNQNRNGKNYPDQQHSLLTSLYYEK